MSKTILVTGGAGFIANHLCEALVRQGNTVVAFDDLSLGRERNVARLQGNKNFTFIKGNILNEPEFQNVFATYTFDTVFHLAANSDIAVSGKFPEIDFKNTFLTTYHVLEQVRKNNIKELIFTSTGAIFGDTDEAVNENSGPLNPVSHYGAAKLASEAYISAYSNNFGIQAWIVRFPNVVGEYATHGAVFDFINRLKKNPTQLEVFGNGGQIKPYIYVKEIVDAICFVWTNAHERLNIYNIGVSTRTTVKEIAQMVVEEMGLTPEVKFGDSPIGWVGDVPSFRYDFSKLTKLGWAAKLSSNDAVRTAIKNILIEQQN